MVLQLAIPDYYGYVVLSSLVGPFLTNTVMGSAVMAARTKFNVPYPNLYATPGYHEKADAFNRIQRGHQNMLESMPAFMIMAMIGGFEYPIVTTIAGLCYNVGCYLFLKGYADDALDVKTARYQKGGGLKWIGIFMALGTCVATAGRWNAWW